MKLKLSLKLAAAFAAFAVVCYPLGSFGQSSQTNTSVKVTAYSAHCKNDAGGSGAGSAGKSHKVQQCTGSADPANHSLNQSGRYQVAANNAEPTVGDNWVMAAIPQQGAPANLKLGCSFHLAQFPGVTFRACDYYGTGSNHKSRVDISMPCGDMHKGNYKKKMADQDKIEDVDCNDTAPANGGGKTQYASANQRTS